MRLQEEKEAARYGAQLVIGNPDYDRGLIFTVFFSVMSGNQALAAALPNLSIVYTARGAATQVLKVINMVREIH